jgi:transcriptional regulator with XRE-family HTH domain
MADQQMQDLLVLGKAIQEVREQHGLGAHDLAAASGVAPARVTALEDGRLDPDFELLLALAKSMGIRPTAFFVRAEQLGSREAPGKAEDEERSPRSG